MTDNTFNINDILLSENLAEDMEEEDLDSIASDVIGGYIADRDSRSEWEDRQEQYMKLAMQVVEEKSFPWKGAANVKFPLLTTASMQFSARAYPALVPGVNLVKGKITGYDATGEKMDKAERIGKHMSYQLLEEMDGWEEDMDRLCMSVPITGTIFKKTYYNPTTGTNCSELVYPIDLVVDYYAKSLEKAHRITHRMYMSENDIVERERTGLYREWEHLDEGIKEDGNLQEELHGQTKPSKDEYAPHEVIEQHTYLDLDGDGYYEPYVITVHLASEKVLRIVARFDEDGIYERDDEIYKIDPIHYFTKFGFIPNPDGSFYDIGFGQLLTPLNETTNTLINQLLDGGTMANRAGGFISKGIRMKGGESSFSPFEWKFVNTTGDDLRKGIFPLPVREPSQVLFSLLGTIVSTGEKMVAVTDMLMGENPGQNQPATTSMAVLEQGLKVFTSIYKRLYRALKEEYKKLFVLNGKYLPDETYFNILDFPQPEQAMPQQQGMEQGQQPQQPPQQQQQQVIAREDYNDETADVQPYADPNIASDTMRMLKAKGLLELVQLGTLNPLEVTRRVLQAQDQPNIEALLMPPPEGPSPEEKKLEMEQQIEQAKIQLEKERLQLEAIKVEAQAQLNLAKAREIGDASMIREAELYIEELRFRLEAQRGGPSGRNQRNVSGMEGQQG